MKRYSILIPAYNVEKYIVECVESVFSQTGNEKDLMPDSFEIIIADDGSTDSTGKICDELALIHSNITVYHKKNEGQLLTRRFLIEKASAEYILFLDADDKYEKTILKTLNNCIEQYNHPDMVCFSFNLWQGETYCRYEQINTTVYYDSKNINKAWEMLLCGDTYNSVGSKAVKRSILLGATVEKSLENIRRGEDKLQSIAALEKAKSILFIPHPLYDYRIDNASMTRTFNPNYFCEIITVDSYAFEKLLKYTSGSEEYKIKWGENLVNKFVDYLLSAFTNLHKDEALEYIKSYASDDTVIRAVMYAKKGKRIKTKIKAYAVSMKLYKILWHMYQRRL